MSTRLQSNRQQSIRLQSTRQLVNLSIITMIQSTRLHSKTRLQRPILLKNKVMELHWQEVGVFKFIKQKNLIYSSTLAFTNCQCNARTLFFKRIGLFTVERKVRRNSVIMHLSQFERSGLKNFNLQLNN